MYSRIVLVLAFLESSLHGFPHQDDGPPPTSSYTNYKPLVDTLNLKIEAFNIENGAKSALKLHQTGERTLDKGKKRIFQFQAFREPNREDMMHLVDNKRFKMVKCLVKYLTKATAKSYQHLEQPSSTSSSSSSLGQSRPTASKA